MSSQTKSIVLWVLCIGLVVVAGAYYFGPNGNGAMDSQFPTPSATPALNGTPAAGANGYIPCTAAEAKNHACPRDYRPVCGNNGITYSNRCSACAGYATGSTKPGACPTPTPPVTDSYLSCSTEEKLATACTREYVPYCGNNGTTYSNRCTACASAGVTSAKPGECGATVPKPTSPTCTALEKASTICTLEYAPVCGDDGVTYSNRCMGCAAAGVTSVTQGACH